ncbi:Acyl-CoA N-acyltransferase [Penicillium cinerascens]|uniref:Acyl-CoA N-acyltransferase n=1 Tax=Penicillium cinerascens TaxID=70096 RepID=A0A9W9JG05_9EURO|nr:Acyl-CoA N-acyltransferase [Penicillium cinerascens]KAJ5195336.1 Acyl-CoA N-acyltransferase [Penicillium cinerascens]
MQPPSTSQLYKLVSHPGDPAFRLQSTSTDLILRLPTITEISILVDILENKENSKFDKSISEATSEELETIAWRWTTISRPLTHLNFLIWHHKNPIGIAGLGWIGACDANDGSRAGAAGVLIQPFARGKGHAYEALRMVVDYGLRELGLMEIRIASHSGNVPMKMLMERKLGLRPEVREDGVDQFGNDLLWIVRKETYIA